MKQLSLGLTWTAQYALGVQYSEKNRNNAPSLKTVTAVTLRLLRELLPFQKPHKNNLHLARKYAWIAILDQKVALKATEFLL